MRPRVLLSFPFFILVFFLHLIFPSPEQIVRSIRPLKLPLEDTQQVLRGTASWYGVPFHGRLTANGERYDMYRFSAAHKTLKLGTYLEVTNLANGRSVIVKVNDRGPYIGNRILDLSYAAAKEIGYVDQGLARVEARVLKQRPSAMAEKMTAQ